MLAETAALAQRLAGLEKVQAGPEIAKPAHAATEVVQGAEVFVPIEGLIDLEAERRRLQERVAKEEALLSQILKKLDNRSFVDRAPREIVERERARAEAIRQAVEAVRKNLAELA